MFEIFNKLPARPEWRSKSAVSKGGYDLTLIQNNGSTGSPRAAFNN